MQQGSHHLFLNVGFWTLFDVLGLVLGFVIVAACFGGHCVTVGVCHFLSKSAFIYFSPLLLLFLTFLKISQVFKALSKCFQALSLFLKCFHTKYNFLEEYFDIRVVLHFTKGEHPM